jgi:hypothetical protein
MRRIEYVRGAVDKHETRVRAIVTRRKSMAGDTGDFVLIGVGWLVNDPVDA